jgi:hypothetical protein
MADILEFNLEGRIERELQKLETLHLELDEIYEALNGVEERLELQQEVFDQLIKGWECRGNPVPTLWKLYARNQKLSDEDFLFE